MLSGSRGTRLRPLIFTLAKQLILLANKSVLGYVLDQVAETGIIVASETGHYVKEYVKDGSEWNFNVTYPTRALRTSSRRQNSKKLLAKRRLHQKHAKTHPNRRKKNLQPEIQQKTQLQRHRTRKISK